MTREVNCMNCMIGRFKDDLCDEKMCEALKSIGDSDDFVDIIMLAKELVWCKDCKDSRVYGKTTQWLACENVMEGQATDPDGYCYLGERREP